MPDDETVYCIECGAHLESGHRYCWRCGAERWHEPIAPQPAGPAQPTQAAQLIGLLPWVYAAGAVGLLVFATQQAAMVLAPAGRAELYQTFGQRGVPSVDMGLMVVDYAVMVVGVPILGAVFHALAFYGLRRMTRWGWIFAVVVASVWSLVLLGIPFLVRLLNPEVRQGMRRA